MNAGLSPSHDQWSRSWHMWFAKTVRFVVAPVLLLCIGFFTADFLLSGLYTWPRTSRVLMLTITAMVFSYEFVFKEQRSHTTGGSPERAIKALIYSCLIPYAVGFLFLIGVAMAEHSAL